MSKENKYNKTVAWFYKTGSGNYRSITVNAEILNAISQVQIGDKLFMKPLPEERRQHENYPHAVLEIMSKESVDKWRTEMAAKEAAIPRAPIKPIDKDSPSEDII